MAQFSGEVFWLKYPANFSDQILICQPSHCQPDFPAKFSGKIIRPNLPTKIRHPNLPAKLSDQFLPEHECSGSIFGQIICWPKIVIQIFWPNYATITGCIFPEHTSHKNRMTLNHMLPQEAQRLRCSALLDVPCTFPQRAHNCCAPRHSNSASLARCP